MARLGNTGVSSLLSAAQSAATQQANLEDQAQSFAWEFGPQDSGAYSSYKSYLDGRVKQVSAQPGTTNAEKVISLQRAGITAFRTFNTNEVQNKTLDIMTGNASEEDKLRLLADQVGNAVKVGADPQTIQSLQSLYGTQAIKVANAQQAAADKAISEGKAASSEARTAQHDAYTEKIQTLKDQIQAIDFNFKQTGKFDTGIKVGDKQLTVDGAKKLLYDQIIALGHQAATDGILTPVQQASLASEAQGVRASSAYADAAANVAAEVNGFHPEVAVAKTGPDGTLQYETRKSYENGILAHQNLVNGNPTGGFNYQPIENPQATSKGVMGDSRYAKIVASLNKDGLNPRENADGTLTLYNPKLGHDVVATVDPASGNVRYLAQNDQGQMYEGNVIITDAKSAKNDNPFEDVSFQQLQAEQAKQDQQNNQTVTVDRSTPGGQLPGTAGASFVSRASDNQVATFDLNQAKTAANDRIAAFNQLVSEQQAIAKQNQINPLPPVQSTAPSPQVTVPGPTLQPAPNIVQNTAPISTIQNTVNGGTLQGSPGTGAVRRPDGTYIGS